VAKGQGAEQGSEREAGLQAQYASCSLTRRSSGSSNGMPPGPEARYGVHFLSSGPGGTPLLSPLAPTLGSTQDFCSAFVCFGCTAIQNLIQASLVSYQAKSWSGPAGAGQCKGGRPQAAGTRRTAALTSFGVRVNQRWPHNNEKNRQNYSGERGCWRQRAKMNKAKYGSNLLAAWAKARSRAVSKKRHGRFGAQSAA
jgi:hypothetical protein